MEIKDLIKNNHIKLKSCRFPYYESSEFKWMLKMCLDDIWGESFGYCESVEGNYEINNIRLNKGDIVLDVGANIGLFSAYACYKGCKVFAFEPLERNVRIIRQLKEENNYDIEIIQCALSNYNGKRTMYNSGNDLGGGTIEQDIRQNNLKRDSRHELCTFTNVLKLDKLYDIGIINKVNFIKADIEGSEIFMLEGGRKLINDFKPKLSLCSYHRESDPDTLENLIKSIRDDYIIVRGEKKIYGY